MKKTKKEINHGNDINDTDKAIKSFICILTIIILLVVAIYFLSKLNNNKQNNRNISNNEVTIQYDDITIGMIFNRPYEEYYVLVYYYDNNNSSKYSQLATNYRKDGNKKLYTINLDDSINRNFVSNNNQSNIKAQNIDEMMFGEEALLYIKNEKIVNYVVGYDNISKRLK